MTETKLKKKIKKKKPKEMIYINKNEKWEKAKRNYEWQKRNEIGIEKIKTEINYELQKKDLLKNKRKKLL